MTCIARADRAVTKNEIDLPMAKCLNLSWACGLWPAPQARGARFKVWESDRLALAIEACNCKRRMPAQRILRVEHKTVAPCRDRYAETDGSRRCHHFLGLVPVHRRNLSTIRFALPGRESAGRETLPIPSSVQGATLFRTGPDCCAPARDTACGDAECAGRSIGPERYGGRCVRACA